MDLNGTLVAPVLVETLAELRPIEGIAAEVARLCRAGFICPVVTVQSRIEKGLFSEAEFRVWFEAFASGLATDGAILAGPYVCPHRFGRRCACAKPQTLLYERAATDLGLRLQASFAVGDTEADVEAAYRFGGRGCLVRTGNGAHGLRVAQAHQFASFIGGSLHEVVDWILRQETA